jgi:tetratricopeptide (TPR) repeat protein
MDSDILIGIIGWAVLLLLIAWYYKRKRKKGGKRKSAIKQADELADQAKFQEAYELIKGAEMESKEDWMIYSKILALVDQDQTLLKVNYKITKNYDLSNYEMEQIHTRNVFAFYNTGKYEDAVNEFQQLDQKELKEDAKIIESNSIFYTAGLCFRKMNEPKIALETFKKADLSLVKNYEKTREVLIEMANCNLKLKRKKTAIDQYQKAQSIKFDKKLSEHIQKLEAQ